MRKSYVSRLNALLSEVRRRGGIARATTLQGLGHSKYLIACAVAEGQLRRVRRVWVATPDADGRLVIAARDGVVLSCLTQAERIGLWMPPDHNPDELHVAASASAGHIAAGAALVHRALPLVPRHPDDLSDPIENVLDLVARCLPFIDALAVWESALHAKETDLRALSRLELSAPARRIAREASPFPESGLESIVGHRLRWLKLPIVPQAWIEGHRVDFLIGQRLVLQIDGRHHVGPQRTQDIRHDAELALLGYHVIRVSYAQVVYDWPAVQDLITRAVAQGMHRAT